MRVATAIKMIEEHGHKAFVTPEGLACVCEVVDAPRYASHDIENDEEHTRFVGDVVFEEVTTLPMISGNSCGDDWDMVATKHVRDWLGY